MRILIVSHGFPPHAQGGAEIYAHAQAMAFARSGDEVFVLTRESDSDRPEYAVRREHRDGVSIAWVNNTFADVRSFADTYINDRVGEVAATLIAEWSPDVAHLHHLTCLSTAIAQYLAARQVPIFYTLHDYWLMCHRGQLLDTNLQPCAGPGPDGCRACLGAAASVAPAAYAARSVLSRMMPPAAMRALRGTVARAGTLGFTSTDRGAEASKARLDHMRMVIAPVTRFFAPSQYMRDRFVQVGIDPSRITVSEYGWALPRTRASDGPAGGLTNAARPLRLGFLGSLMVSKAPHLLLEACARLAAGSVSVDLFGDHVDYHGDIGYRTQLEPLLNVAGVRQRGRVPHEDVASVFEQIDVLVVPSIWAENSPIVIREAFLAGVPVVASRVGGIPETVTDEVNGLLFARGDVDDLQRVLARLIDEPGLLPRLRRGIPPVRTLDDDVACTRRWYAEALQSRPARKRMAAVVLNYGTPDDTFLATRSLLLSRRPLDDVIVVDNDVTDACRTALRPIFDRINYIQTGSNLGFSGGVNVGVRAALARGAQRILLVNSDLIVPVDAVGALERTLDATANAGIVAPAVMARHAPDRVASLGMSYSRTTGRMRHRDVGARLSELSGPAVCEVAGVAGCLVLIAKDVFDSIGFFDEDYFFGFEDLDFCLRARDAGYGTFVDRRVRAFHEGGRSLAASSPRRLYFAARNHLLLSRRNSGAGTRLGASLRQLMIVAFNTAYACRANPGSVDARLRAVARGTGDYFAGRFGNPPN